MPWTIGAAILYVPLFVCPPALPVHLSISVSYMNSLQHLYDLMSYWLDFMFMYYTYLFTLM